MDKALNRTSYKGTVFMVFSASSAPINTCKSLDDNSCARTNTTHTVSDKWDRGRKFCLPNYRVFQSVSEFVISPGR